MEIESKVSIKKDNGEVVSADVMLYDNEGDVVKRITIVDSNVLQNLESTIEVFRNTYISNNQLMSILANPDSDLNINASKVMNVDGDKLALKTDIPHVMEPTKHDSTTQTYGVGSTSRYGHVKIRDDLFASSFISGEALSAFQGAVLHNRLATAESKVNQLENRSLVKSLSLKIGRGSDREGFTSDEITVAQGSTILIKGYSSDGNFDWTGKRINIYVNGAYVTRTMNDSGECSVPLNLPVGDHFLVAFTGDSGNREGCIIAKKVKIYASN